MYPNLKQYKSVSRRLYEENNNIPENGTKVPHIVEDERETHAIRNIFERRQLFKLV